MTITIHEWSYAGYRYRVWDNDGEIGYDGSGLLKEHLISIFAAEILKLKKELLAKRKEEKIGDKTAMDYLTRCKIAGYVIQQPTNHPAYIGSGSLMWRLGPENTKNQWFYITEELGLSIGELCKEGERNDIINSINQEKANKLYAGRLVAFLKSDIIVLGQIPDRAISADLLSEVYKINANNNSTIECFIKFTLDNPSETDPSKTDPIALVRQQERARIRQELLEACPPSNWVWVNDWLRGVLDRILPVK